MNIPEHEDLAASDDYLADFDANAVSFLPWRTKSAAELEKQKVVQATLAKKAGATFGPDAYVSADAKVFTQKLKLGKGSWIAGGAILRGSVEIGESVSVNPYAHIAGKVKIGNNCRIASLVSIYGFNHGFASLDRPIKDQAITSKGVVLNEDIWVGANAVILDGVELGSHCIVAAGAVVTKSFPAYQIIGGNPARVIRDRRDAQTPAEPAPPAPNTVMQTSSKQVRGLLHAEDPYVSPRNLLPPDLQGWDSQHRVFAKIIEEVEPRLIAEIGTWKGASAIHMARLCRQNGLDTEIVCIDTWLGNWQHWSRSDGAGSRKDLRLINGFPHLYDQFISNVLHEGVNEIITPLPLTGVAGAKLFAHYKLRPDIVYIDGDHEYESVVSDLRLWLPLVAPGGCLIGNDYNWPGVKRAAEEVASAFKHSLESFENKFVMRPKQD